MKLTDRLLLQRAEFVLWRASRRARRQLRHDLAQHTSSADCADLLAAFDRYPDAATQQMRDVVSRRAQRDGRPRGVPRPVPR
jgi:uncharacterized protein (DUF1778 family)